jgi:hypothetical protein
MSGGRTSPDLEEALKELDALFVEGMAPSAGQLKRARDLLDDATFLPELKKLLERRHNDPQVYEIPNTIIRIMRKAEELQGQREFTRNALTSAGIGGSTALVVGGILACLNPAIGLVVLIPAAGGAWMAIEGYMAGRKLELERVLYKQIAERLATISKGLDE